MSHIRSTDTSLEKRVFRYLRKEKVHFQPYYKKAPGKPDIALPRKKKAVFIDGDFWHGWKFGETGKRLPARYWRRKILKNMERDRKNRAKLRREGWRVLRVWEHELNRNERKALEKIRAFLTGY